MGLPMYVSPSIPKRQLPSKQPTSPPYTPQTEESYDETFQNGRTNVFDIPESQTESSQRSQRSRRSSSLPYNLVQQHIHRLHQLQQLHRTREQQHISPNLASRRGLNSVHHLSLNHRSQIQHLQQMQMAAQARRENNFDHSRNFREDDSHDEMFDLSFDDFVTSLDNNNNYIGDVQNDNNNNNSNNNNNNNSSSNSSSNNNNNDNHNNNNNSNHHHHHHHHHRSSNSSSVALDNVIRRVNLLRQISQQQEIRNMRSSSRHHRSSTGHSSGRSSSRITSQNTNVDRRRDDLIQRGIDIHPSRHPIPDSNLLYEHSVPFPPVQRLSAWHTRRGVNWSTVDPPPVQRTERRSSFADDFYSIPHQYESDDHHLSRIISPIPRRYDSRFSISSLPIGNDHGLLLENNNNNNNSSNNRSSNNDSIGTGSAAGGVC